jgi:hypothetical protein
MSDWRSYRSIADMEQHTCRDTCVCPIHRNPMFYSAAVRLHACQNPGCEYAVGVDLDRLTYEAILATEAFRRLVPRGLRHEFWPTIEDVDAEPVEVDDECE